MSNTILNFNGLAGLNGYIARLNSKLSATTILDEATAVLLNRTRTRYLSQTSPEGTRWPVSYASILRAINGRGGGTLYDTSRLFHSIQLFSIGANRAIGTNVFYGAYHQYGTQNMPVRRFLGWNDEDNSIAVKLVMKRIEKALHDE